MKKRHILFDFDGVIADSFNLCFEIQKKICPHLTIDSYRQRFEGNISDWEDPAHVHTPECRRDIDFFAKYIPRMMQEVEIVSGMKETIIELEKTHSLIVISSTITSPIQDYLKLHGLATHFTEIIGIDVDKSKIKKMKLVFKKYGVKPDDCVFITDTLGDMIEASHTGVGSIGVRWGFHLPETLQRGAPFCLVEKPRDLLTAVADYFTVSE